MGALGVGIGGSCCREQGGSTSSVCVGGMDINHGEENMSNIRPGEILGLYVMSL